MRSVQGPRRQGATFAILEKDARTWLLPLFVLWPVVVFAEIFKVGGLDLGLVLLNSLLLVFLTVGSVLANEIEEESNGGYRIYRGLPALGTEIVTAKFLGAFLLTLAFTGSHFVLANSWCADPDRVHHIHTAVLSSGVLSLTILGVLFLGIFTLGLAKAMSVLGISFWLVSAVFILLVTILGWNVDSTVGGFVEIVGRTDHMVTLAVGLLFYGLVWSMAVGLSRVRSG